MGRPFHEHLGDGHVYCCAVCKTPVVNKEALLSKVRHRNSANALGLCAPDAPGRLPPQAFHARSGKAYLFHHAANVFTGEGGRGRGLLQCGKAATPPPTLPRPLPHPSPSHPCYRSARRANDDDWDAPGVG